MSLSRILHSVDGAARLAPFTLFSVFLLASPAPAQWEARADSVPRSASGACSLGGRIYLFGGLLPAGGGNSTSTNRADVYDPATDTWTALPPMQFAHVYPAVGVVKGRIYVCSGSSGGNPNQWLPWVEEFDPTANTWRLMSDIPTPRMGAGAAVVNDKVYVIGGWNGNLLATCEEYDPTTDSWTTRASMPTPRYMVPCAELNGLIYAVAGWDITLTSANNDKNEVYDPVTDTWTTLAPLTTPRYLHGAAALGGRIWAVGGLTPGDPPPTPILGVESFDPSTNAWSPEPQLNTPRFRVAVTALENCIYAIGGGDDASSSFASGFHTGTNERYCVSPGTTYCTATVNSTGVPASISASGTASSAAGDLVLASNSVPDRPGLFFHGANQVQLPFGDGFLCTTGVVRGKVVVGVGNFASYGYDNSDAQHSVAAFIGSTRHFQYWFRDMGGTGWNLSDAISIAILP